MNQYCFALTATIAPNGMTFTRRVDPVVRENDYKVVINKLLNNFPISIVFGENSGFPLDAIKAELSKSGFPTESLTLTEGQSFDVRLGKGYGEMVLLENMISNSKLLVDSKKIIKLTGRYYVRNLHSILNKIDGVDFEAAAYFEPDSRYAMSGIFIANQHFYNNYLFPLKHLINDSEKMPFEVILRMALDKAALDGHKIVKIEKPVIEGYSGTWNAKISEKNYNDVKFSVGKMIIVKQKIYQFLKRKVETLLKIIK